jgi:hypothetical protein
VKRPRTPMPTRAELARALADLAREREQLMDVLAESAREVTNLRAQLSGAVS